MQSSPNWGLLYASGRCKAIGIAWSETELNAIHKLKIPFEYVRLGCLTQEDYLKMKNEAEEVEKQTGEKPLQHLKKEELLAKVKDFGVSVDEKAVTRNDLIVIIKQELDKEQQEKRAPNSELN